MKVILLEDVKAQGKKGEIVVEQAAGALTRAPPHSAAQTAICSTVIFVFTQLHFGGVSPHVSEHIRAPLNNNLLNI